MLVAFNLGSLININVAACQANPVMVSQKHCFAIQERCDLVKVAVETVAKRIPVIAATGSQSLAETVELTEQRREPASMRCS